MANAEDRYTPRLRQALVFAVQVAVGMKHSAAGPEHILLGMMREGTGLASASLANLGVDLYALRDAVASSLPPGEKAVSGEVEYSAEAQRMFELAADEARLLKTSYVGQEHFLLALLHDEGSPVAQALAKFDVTYQLARAQILEILKGTGDAGRVKRYNLALPEDLFREVEQLAEREHMTVLEVLRRSVKLGLLVAQAQETQGASFIIREGATERQIVLL
ncbi:MAG: Clp protease N-terminal domain-containing protein [Dehalococcoidia bacterium]